MSVPEIPNNLSLLLVIVGTSDAELENARSSLANLNEVKCYFVCCNKLGNIELKTVLKNTIMQSSGWDMVVVIATSETLKQALMLSKIAKDRGILSVVASEAMSWNVAEYLAAHGLDQEKILTHMDCLLLAPDEQICEKNFYCHIGKFLAFTRDLVDDKGFINLDFADVCDVLKDAGLAYVSSTVVNGTTYEERQQKMVNEGLVPRDVLAVAKRALIEVVGCMDMGLNEVDAAVDVVQRDLYPDGLTIFGASFDDQLEDKMQVMVLVADFNL